MKKKILPCVLGLVMALGIIAGATVIVRPISAQAESAASSTQFDPENVAVTFSVMSDVHMGYGEEAVAALRTALRRAGGKKWAPYGLDAMMFCGDQTLYGKREEAELFAQVLRERYDLTKTAAVVAHGNHDTCWSGCMPRAEWVEVYGEDMYSFDDPDTDPRTGNRHAVVKGYHFLAVEIDFYSGKDNTNPISADTEKWLRSTLDKLTAQDPDRYIFVASHCPAPDTVYGSYAYNTHGTWGSSKELDAVLKNYPQVVLFSGHTHYAINDERSVNQSAYTQIHAGSTTDMAVDSDYLEKVIDPRKESNGMVVEVDGAGAVRVTRIDFARNLQIKNHWYLDPCRGDGAHLNRYTPGARAEANIAPRFPEGRQLVLEELDGGKARITYPAATDDDMVFCYKIGLYKENGEAMEEVKSYSPWYYDPQLSELPTERKIVMFFTEKPVVARVTAYDSFGAASETLTATIADPDAANKDDDTAKDKGCGGSASGASVGAGFAAAGLCALCLARGRRKHA